MARRNTNEHVPCEYEKEILDKIGKNKTNEKTFKMLEDFLNYVKDIGFTQVLNYSNTPYLIFLTYGYYTLSIYNPEGQRFENSLLIRYSLELKKDDYSVYIGKKEIINFAIDDLEVLQTEFKDVIRDNMLREIGI